MLEDLCVLECQLGAYEPHLLLLKDIRSDQLVTQKDARYSRTSDDGEYEITQTLGTDGVHIAYFGVFEAGRSRS